MPLRRLPDFACVSCGALFRPNDSTRKYCSVACVPSLPRGRPEKPWRPFTQADIDCRSELVTETGCRIWTGSVSNRGYGVIKMKEVRFSAHRVAWQVTHGEIPTGLVVMHKCDTPTCVNVSHLAIGTQLENMADRDRKGRGRPGGVAPVRRKAAAK